MAQERLTAPIREPATSMTELEARLEQLKPRLRLAVIFGGNNSTPGGVAYPSRNTRSWKSYEAVAADIAASLQRTGFRHVQLLPDDVRLGERLVRDRIHMAWLNTGGVQGCNPMAHASSLLEMLGIPYVGHDPLNATTLDNKHAFKREAACAGLPTAQFTTWHMARGAFQPAVDTRFRRAFGDYQGPFVVKPVSGRASLHVHVVPDRAGLPEAVATVHEATDNLVLIEKYLSGREYCIAVAGPVVARQGSLQRNPHPFAFSGLERVLAADEKIFTSMDQHPITEKRCRNLDPGSDKAQLETLRRLAREVYLELNLGSLVRIDFRADADGSICILEANPKPDLKAPVADVTSLVAAGLPAIGMGYDDLILSLLADRLDHLFTHRRDSIDHIVDMLEPAQSAGAATQAYRGAAREALTAEASMTVVEALAAHAATDPSAAETAEAAGELATEAGVGALSAISDKTASRTTRRAPPRVRQGRA